MQKADVIVLGVGGMGSSACLHLAKRGVSVIGLEQFTVGHNRGSSHGETRMIRQAYFEHVDYVPLLKRAYELWDELSEECERELFSRVGVLYAGRENSVILKGVRSSAKTHGLKLLEVGPEEQKEEYAAIRFPKEMKVWLEPDAGYLEVENAVLAHAAAARRKGAVIHENTEVLSWKIDKGRVLVLTSRGEFESKRLVITSGAWRTERLSTPLPIQIHRNVVAWYPCDERYDRESGMPCFGFDLDVGFLYGFPRISQAGMKAGIHIPGMKLGHPNEIDRTIHPEETRLLAETLASVFPGVIPRVSLTSTCFYCLSPDENFIIDRHPEHSEVVFAAGFSGHGFKFASVIGEILAELSLEGHTKHPIDFLKLTRLESGR